MPDQFWDLTPGEFLLLRRSRREESYRMSRYLAYAAAVMTWAQERPPIDEFVLGAERPPQTPEQITRNLDLWATTLMAVLPPQPVNEVPA